jgi:hypothetical protein
LNDWLDDISLCQVYYRSSKEDGDQIDSHAVVRLTPIAASSAQIAMIMLLADIISNICSETIGLPDAAGNLSSLSI